MNPIIAMIVNITFLHRRVAKAKRPHFAFHTQCMGTWAAGCGGGGSLYV